jgi:uncharacterized protein YfbU (UPF0304 family)
VHLLEFKGFDGNHETEQLAYAQHCCTDEPRAFPALRVGNSHSHYLPRYRRMLAAWKQCANPHRMIKEDLGRIVNVKAY